MAYIFKPKFPKLRIIRSPDGRPLTETRTVERSPRKGQRIKVVKREPELDDAGNVVMVESRTWVIEYSDFDRRRRRVKGYTDKGMTLQKAAALEKGVIRQREGVVGVDAEHSQTRVSEHIEAWLADLDRGERSREYTRKLRPRLARLVKDLEWSVPGSIRPDGLTKWLGNQTRAGASARTVNHYLQAAVAFCNWCKTERRIESNPLESIRSAKVVGPRVPRRALTVDELRRLVEKSPKRRVIYLTAALTGLRRAELAALEWGDVHLDAEQPHIALRASTTKSRRADTVAVKDELATAGVNPRVAMQQLRHTDIRPTTKLYTDPRLLDLHRAVNSLPRIADAPSREAQAATGTYGREKEPPKKSRMGSSLGSDLTASAGSDLKWPKTPIGDYRGDEVPQVVTECVTADPDRTYESDESESATQCHWARRESNPHRVFTRGDFKSPASAIPPLAQ